MPYNPAHKLPNEDKMSMIEKTQLQHAYTFWVLIREQNFK